MAGLFVWAAWHGEGLLHLSEHSSGPERRDQLPQSPLGNRITLLENLLSFLIYQGSNWEEGLQSGNMDQCDGLIREL